MCGRFSLTPTVAAILADFFGIPLAALMPRWNIRPTEAITVVRTGVDGGREAANLRWGLVAPWVKDPRAGAPLINARAETVAEKPTFRRAFRSQRCLVPADGFYEWLPPPADAAIAGGRLTAPMPGRVAQVLVAAGDTVRQGQALLVVEAMKMEHTIAAPRDGTVAVVHYRAGDPVEEGAELIALAGDDSAPP